MTNYWKSSVALIDFQVHDIRKTNDIYNINLFGAKKSQFI